MTTVAVTGAASALGKALLERLDADRAVERIVGLDAAEPDMPVAKLDFHMIDVRDPLPAGLFAGVDAVVHLAAQPDELFSDRALFAVGVQGTRNVLEAAGRDAVAMVVHVSSAMVYGAHPDNPLPIDETRPLRANRDFPPAYHALLAERQVDAFASAHPHARVAVLRPAAMLGVGVDTAVSRHLESPRLPLVRGLEPTVQFVDVDDLAAAAHLAVANSLAGPYNVAAEGWLMAAEVCRLLGRRPLWLPEQVALGFARRLWRMGVTSVPPGALQYLMYPWVVDTTRLHEAGWAPRRSNREILRAFAAVHHGYLTVGRVRVRRAALAWAAFGAAAALALAVVAGSGRATRPGGRRRRRGSRPTRRRRGRSSAPGPS